MEPLNIFYEEPETDRWFKYDRFPRRVIRRIYRGRPIPSGQFLVFYNLIQGLKKLGIPFRLNDYKYIKAHPEEIACIIGRDQVLDKISWKNPIVFGAAFGINPVTHPDILSKYPIVRLLVPGPWVKDFFNPYGEKNVAVWPVGIDTEIYRPGPDDKKFDFLIYNKIRWDKEKMDKELIVPIKKTLSNANLSFREITYGSYKPVELKAMLTEAKFAIFICEHETQGIAYQQILASGIPMLAWDRGGFWQDPYWYPDRIRYEPVTAVPYWDERCGVKFTGFDDFEDALPRFLKTANSPMGFDPRAFIMDNLTLEICANNYVQIIEEIKTSIGKM